MEKSLMGLDIPQIIESVNEVFKNYLGEFPDSCDQLSVLDVINSENNFLFKSGSKNPGGVESLVFLNVFWGHYIIDDIPRTTYENTINTLGYSEKIEILKSLPDFFPWIEDCLSRLYPEYIVRVHPWVVLTNTLLLPIVFEDRPKIEPEEAKLIISKFLKEEISKSMEDSEFELQIEYLPEITFNKIILVAIRFKFDLPFLDCPDINPEVIMDELANLSLLISLIDISWDDCQLYMLFKVK